MDMKFIVKIILFVGFITIVFDMGDMESSLDNISNSQRAIRDTLEDIKDCQSNQTMGIKCNIIGRDY